MVNYLNQSNANGNRAGGEPEQAETTHDLSLASSLGTNVQSNLVAEVVETFGPVKSKLLNSSATSVLVDAIPKIIAPVVSDQVWASMGFDRARAEMDKEDWAFMEDESINTSINQQVETITRGASV